MNEAMGLAGMNPVVGASGGSPNMMINSLSQDKDLTNGWGSYSITKTLDRDDKYLTIDKNGKLDLYDKKELDECNVAAFYIKGNSEDKLSKLLDETKLPYEERPVHNKNFLYEYFTGHKLYSKDQPLYDPMLEEIELPKFSKVISAGAKGMKDDFAKMEDKVEKDGEYVPDGKSPYSADESHIPLTSIEDICLAQSLLEKHPFLEIYEDLNGYYAYNRVTKQRTESQPIMEDLDLKRIEVQLYENE